MALFWMFRRRGYWPDSTLHWLFGVFIWTLSILLQKSKCRVSIGCFSQFKKSNFIEGPHTSLPYNATWFNYCFEKFEPDLDWDVNFNGSFYGIESPLSFLFEFIHSQSKV